MDHSEVTVRCFEQRDMADLLALSRNTPKLGSHFLSGDDLVRHLTSYPGVASESIFIAEERETICGFAIVSVTDELDLRQGNILELQASSHVVVGSLIQQATDYCIDKGADLIMVAPAPYLDKQGIFKTWQRVEPNILMCKAIALKPAVLALLNTYEIMSKCAGMSITFCIDEEVIVVQISNNGAQVISIDPQEKITPIITMSQKTFIELISGSTNRYLAYIRGKVRIRKTRHILLGLRLLALMKIETPVYVSLGDRV